jgi:hypothetical protein
LEDKHSLGRENSQQLRQVTADEGRFNMHQGEAGVDEIETGVLQADELLRDVDDVAAAIAMLVAPDRLVHHHG